MMPLRQRPLTQHHMPQAFRLCRDVCHLGPSPSLRISHQQPQKPQNPITITTTRRNPRNSLQAPDSDENRKQPTSNYNSRSGSSNRLRLFLPCQGLARGRPSASRGWTCPHWSETEAQRIRQPPSYLVSALWLCDPNTGMSGRPWEMECKAGNGNRVRCTG